MEFHVRIDIEALGPIDEEQFMRLSAASDGVMRINSSTRVGVERTVEAPSADVAGAGEVQRVREVFADHITVTGLEVLTIEERERRRHVLSNLRPG